MTPSLSFSEADPIRASARVLQTDPRSFDPLLEWMGDASIVLIGEGTYGTHEFQRARMAITRRLIEERGFTAVAIDADWRSTRPVNRFVRGLGRATDAIDSLAGLSPFPAWRWRNADLLNFVGWLRAHNEALPPARQAGFYGLNLFGVDTTRERALDLFDRISPECAARLRERAALPPGIAAHMPLGLSTPLKEELISTLLRWHHSQAEAIMQQRRVDEDDYFFLVENARQSRNAEDYYRGLIVDYASVWQLRAYYGAAMIDALLEHQERRGEAKVVVWAHNVLLGDSRAVEEPADPPPSIGQFMRERHAAETYILGQTTDHGTVAAAAGWGRRVERYSLPEAPPGSVEALFHQSGLSAMMLNLHDDDDAVELLREPLLERTPGAVMPPEVPLPVVSVRLADQFDAVLHFDQTRALEPLD